MISQLRALDLAIEELTAARREKYAAGDAAYQQGLRQDKLEGEVTGAPFQWVEDDRKKYVEYTQAIRQLEDLQEILTDPGVTIDED